MRLQVSEQYELVHEAELLDAQSDTSTQTDGNGGGAGQNGTPTPFNWPMIIIVAALFVILIAWLFLSGRKNKSRDREYTEGIEAIKPGNKVMSRGGLCGIVVEVCDDNTVVIETGSENSGKSYFKLAKECIYETDAKGPTQLAREEAELRRKAEKEAKQAAKEGKTPEKPQEEPAEETAPEAAEQPSDENGRS